VSMCAARQAWCAKVTADAHDQRRSVTDRARCVARMHSSPAGTAVRRAARLQDVTARGAALRAAAVAVRVAARPRVAELRGVGPVARADALVDHGAVVACRVAEETCGGIVDGGVVGSHAIGMLADEVALVRLVSGRCALKHVVEQLDNVLERVPAQE
jgi:hypothetical protein